MPSARIEHHGAVAVVTLDRPLKFNALDAPSAAEVRQKLASLAKDKSTRALVLTGAGKAFCAGGDVAAMRAAGPKVAEVFHKLTGEMHPIAKLLATMDKPTVAAVNGVAAGGGFALALACDLRLAAPEARFKPAFSTLGVVPDTGTTWLLPRLVGPARARELLFLDEGLDAARALEWGVVNRVVEGPKLLDEAVAWAQRLADGPAFAFARTKQLLLESGTSTLDEHLRAERRWNRASAEHPDLQEGLAAFAEKRKPRFGVSQP